MFVQSSCVPNCVPIFLGPVMVIFAASDIPAKAEITVPYTDVCLSWIDRRQALLDHWGFECSCVRCEVEEREGNKLLLTQMSEAYLAQRERLLQRLPVNESEVRGIKDRASISKDATFLVPLCLTLLAGAAQMRNDIDTVTCAFTRLVVCSFSNRFLRAGENMRRFQEIQIDS